MQYLKKKISNSFFKNQFQSVIVMKNSKDSDELTNIRNLTRWYIEKGFEFDYVPMEERDAEQANALLLKAEGNLRTAKSTFKSKSYDDSITNTQQAVEKIGKSILIAVGLITPKELKKISHNFSTHLIMKLKQFYTSLNNYLDAEFDSSIIQKIDNYFKTYKEKRRIHSLVQTLDKLEKYLKSYEIIFNSIMSNIETLDKAKIQLPIIEDYRDSFEVVIEEFEKVSDNRINPEEKNKLLKEYNQFFQEQDQLTLITNTIAVIILLSFITILSMNLDMHYERSRYPREKNDFYTKEDEIVKVLPLMMKTLSRIIGHYYYIISINNRTDEEK